MARRWHESFFVKVPGTTPFVNGKGVTEYADRFVLAIPKCASAALTSYHDPEYLDTRRKEYLDGGGRTKSRLYHHDEVIGSGLPVDAYLRPWRERLASTLVRLAHPYRTDTLDSAFNPARMIRQMVEPALVAGPESLSVFLRPQWFYLDGVPNVTLHRMSDLAGQIPVIEHGRPALDWRDIRYNLDLLLPLYGQDDVLLESIRA